MKKVGTDVCAKKKTDLQKFTFAGSEGACEVCSQEAGHTLVFDLEAGGNERRRLTSDSCAEWLGALGLVILYYLDLKEEEIIRTGSHHKYRHVTRHCPKLSKRGTLNRHAGDHFHTTPSR